MQRLEDKRLENRPMKRSLGVLADGRLDLSQTLGLNAGCFCVEAGAGLNDPCGSPPTRYIL